MERYLKVEKAVGEGAYGVVYKGRDQETGEIVAMKKIRLDCEEEGMPSTALREISILKELRHPHIVDLRDVVQDSGRLYLIFEFLDKDLKRYLDSIEGPLPIEAAKAFCYQIMKGLAFCHSRGIMHRDLKPQNLLVTPDGRLKLADFGLARAFCPPIRPLTHEVVTLWYRPPEILLGCTTYAPPVDVWAVGTILVEMVSKRPMFPGDCEIDQIYKIFRMLGTPSEEDWPGCTALQDWNSAFPQWPRLQIESVCRQLDPAGIDLVERTLFFDPKARISARAACNHPYFDSVDKDAYV